MVKANSNQIRTRPVTLEEIKQDREVQALIKAADDALGALGYTEHGQRHANLVAHIAQNILLRLHYPERVAELAAIAAYLHDIGNAINRDDHGQTAALIAFTILREKGMDPAETTAIMAAIGNHEEEAGEPLSEICAAMILADKADVHHSRVRNPDPKTFDIHDRVNHAAQHSFVRVDEAKRTITLEVTIDTQKVSIMDYFEIFLDRMLMCRRAAKVLNCSFELMINRVKMV